MEKISDSDILELFNVMNKAEWHTFQILTKRADRLVELSKKIRWTDNIWMGVSIEDNKSLNRCEKVKKTGARIKFVSAEPLLESIVDINLEGIDWLIVGGESGPRSRPMEAKWVRELKEKAAENGTAFFFKQWGGVRKKKAGNLLDGKEYKEYPNV